MSKIFLGIETSCDETSMAILVNGVLKAHVTTSSANVQAGYGGVVPEVASRYHLQNLHHVFLQTLKEAHIRPEQIDHICYTAYPGLPGSLHIGLVFAQMLGKLTGAQLMPINHLYGHLFSAYIDEPNRQLSFPFLGLVASGGHTTIYDVRSPNEITVLNETSDDAIGEVYDKVARDLGWRYPGGPAIDKAFDHKKADLRFMRHRSPAEQFSYSGIKTAVTSYIHNEHQRKHEIDPVRIASSFQKEIIDDLVEKVAYQLQATGYHHIVVGGGVSANRYLRAQLQQLCPNVDLPPMKYTGDNSAMIVHYGWRSWNNHHEQKEPK